MRDPVPVNKDQGSASTILVVEDEVLIRLHVAEELREAGFPVLEAADAGEALEILSHVDGWN
jgi:CheY-like chemotaxis protein